MSDSIPLSISFLIFLTHTLITYPFYSLPFHTISSVPSTALIYSTP